MKIPSGMEMLLNSMGLNLEEVNAQATAVVNAIQLISKNLTSIDKRLAAIENKLGIIHVPVTPVKELETVNG